MIQVIIGLAASLIVAILAIFGLKNKEKLIELFAKNKEIIDEVKTLSVQIETNNASLNSEEKTRTDLKQDLNGGTTQATQGQLLDFFNKVNKK